MTLTIALPSKGRLKEQSEQFFLKHGFHITINGGERGYTGVLKGLNVQILFLQASEISRRLIDGSLDCGITGIDLLAESQGLQQVYILKELQFGYADLVLAIPQSWIDVHSMEDFEEVSHIFRQQHGHRLRIATKYIHLTAEFFKRHNITDYRIVESLGATEAAPANLTAEAVIDITSTGATLIANHLKILDDSIILKSQAVLTASLHANWPKEKTTVLKHILDVIQAADNAREQSAITAYGLTSLPDIKACPDISMANFTNNIFYGFTDKTQIYNVSTYLQEQGAHTVCFTKTDYMFVEENPVFSDFVKKIL